MMKDLAALEFVTANSKEDTRMLCAGMQILMNLRVCPFESANAAVYKTYYIMKVNGLGGSF